MNSRKITDCYTCIHKRNIPRDVHIFCVKPDPEMKGKEYGVKMGWFIYPINFDPIWKAKSCSNYEEKSR